ncbi:MAG TPA: 2-oxo acid dehydrogenase subunit E2, partial [Bacillota bacterium]|nr:2-oxo acid dehydrogenase subunit E2 [Bacillota bacterium]
EREGGGHEFYPAMGLSLIYDHRAVDGAPAARFMQELCRNLENFTALLVRG